MYQVTALKDSPSHRLGILGNARVGKCNCFGLDLCGVRWPGSLSYAESLRCFAWPDLRRLHPVHIKHCNTISYNEEQGWCSYESAHLPPMWPGLDPGPVPYVAGLSLVLVPTKLRGPPFLVFVSSSKLRQGPPVIQPKS